MAPSVIMPAEASEEMRDYMQGLCDLYCPSHTTWKQEMESIYTAAVRSAPGGGKVSQDQVRKAAEALWNTFRASHLASAEVAFTSFEEIERYATEDDGSESALTAKLAYDEVVAVIHALGLSVEERELEGSS